MKKVACSDIKPAFAERNIPVGLAADENRLPNAAVTIKVSAKSARSSKGTPISVVLTVDKNFLRGALATIRSIAESPGEDSVVVHICHNDITVACQKEFLAEIPAGGRVAVDFVDITAAIEEYGLSKLKHSMWFTSAASYRLLLPNIFPNEDRLIYLDTDLVVLHDLSDLYRTDLRGNWLAAVRGFGYPAFVAKSKKRQKWHKETGLPIETYFNSGVLLIDCAAFRVHDLVSALTKAAEENNGQFIWPDQDALNLICSGHVQFLDDRWNVAVEPCRLRAGMPGGEHFADLLETPFILHYTGRVKPWHDPKSFKAGVWWRFFTPDLDCVDDSRTYRKDIKRLRQAGEQTVDISVVIPTHRRHLFLRTALQSVFSQKGVSFEVIVINGIEDDADTDGVVAAFNGVNYIRSKEYPSCSSKRALGLSLAKGRYIHFLDDDDYLIDNDFYRKAVTLLDANGGVTSFSGSAKLRHERATDGEPTYEDKILPFSGLINGLEYFSKFQLEWSKPSSTCTTIFRTAALIEGEQLKEVNDSSIYLQALLHGNAYIIKDLVAVYRIWDGSMSFDGEGNDLRLKMETAIQKERFYHMASNRIADADKWWRGTFAMNLDYFKQATPDSLELLLFVAWGILHSHGDNQLVCKCVSTLDLTLPETFTRLQNHMGTPKLLLHLRAMLHKTFRDVSGNFEPYYSEVMAGLDAEIAKNREDLDVGLMYFIGFRNFGDLLSCRLMESLSGLGMNCRSMPAADIAAVGSILRQLQRCFDQANAFSGPLHVWGSGFPQTITLQNPPVRGRVIFHAVRGVLTLRHLRELGLVGPEETIALGDPGLLYADIIPGVNETIKEFDVAIVPHHIDSELFRNVADGLSSEGLSVKFVDVSNANPMQVVRDIAASRKVLSSSLHGIIVADSLGIPNLRVVVDGFEEDEKRMLNESHLKFSDYYSAFGLERPKHIYLSELKNAPRQTIDRIGDFVPRDKVEKCKRGLLDAFPFPKRTAVPIVREELPKPGVSVIIPVYNSEYYLRECLDSVLLQEQFSSLELICVDDGSTDSSARIVETYTLNDHRVRLIRQENHGPGIARNAGLEAAKGEYIFFLDADDRLSSGTALLEAYNQAKADDLDILIANGSVMTENGTVEKPNAFLKQNLLPKERVFGPEALGGNLYLVLPMTPWAKLYRRSFLAENKLCFPALRRSEDFPMVQQAMSLSRRIGVLQMPVVDRRIGVLTSLELTKDETPLIFFEAEQLLRDSLKKRKLWSRFKTAVFSAFVLRLAYNLRAVRSYSSFRAIIAKYRQDYQQLICWEDVALPVQYADSLQLVKDIEKETDDDGQIAVFVKLREESAAAHVKAMMQLKLDEGQGACGRSSESLDAIRKGRDMALRMRDNALATLENVKKGREEALRMRDNALATLENVKKGREDALRMRDNALATLEGVKKGREEALRMRDNALATLENVKKGREEALRMRDNALATLENVKKGRDDALRLRDVANLTIEKVKNDRQQARDALAATKKAMANVMRTRDAAVRERDAARRMLSKSSGELDRALEILRKIEDVAEIGKTNEQE